MKNRRTGINNERKKNSSSSSRNMKGNRLTMLTTRQAHETKEKKIPLSFARAFSKRVEKKDENSVMAAPPDPVRLFFRTWKKKNRYRHSFATVLTRRLEEIVKNKEFTFFFVKSYFFFLPPVNVFNDTARSRAQVWSHLVWFHHHLLLLSLFWVSCWWIDLSAVHH